MKHVRTIFSTLGGILLAALLIAALAPKAARGVAATLVQVVNSKSSPVNVADVSPQQVFQSDCNVLGVRDNTNQCSISVPAGKRLVAQTVAVRVLVDPGVRVSEGVIDATVGGEAVPIYLNIPFNGSFDVFDLSIMSQELRFYHDGGSDLLCLVLYTANTNANGLICSVTGYLVDAP